MNIVPQDFVTVASTGVLTDSRTVAKHFKKRHGDVLRAVGKVECSAEFGQRNFASSSYVNAQGKTQREVTMTKDGFMFLAMGFTGREAARIKEAFIAAFNRMAEFIRAQQSSAFDAFNRAYQEHLSDKRHVSQSARDMRRWQDVKPQQLAQLNRLHPQLALFH